MFGFGCCCCTTEGDQPGAAIEEFWAPERVIAIVPPASAGTRSKTEPLYVAALEDLPEPEPATSGPPPTPAPAPAATLARENSYVEPANAQEATKPKIANYERILDFMKQGHLGIGIKERSCLVTQVSPDGCIGKAQAHLPRDQQITTECTVLGVNGERLSGKHLIEKMQSFIDGDRIQMIFKVRPQ
jgi:hypothetical protein